MGKTVVITGGAQGQGLSHALMFAKAGYQVVIGDILPLEDERVKSAADRIKEAGGQVLAVVCDVCHTKQVEEMFAKAAETFGTIDVVVSNAGIMTFGKTWELSDDKVQQTLDINLMGTWRVNKEAVKYMMGQKCGRIINISSTAGLKGTPNLGHYTMSKFGVIGLTKTLAKEVAGMGITVNVICPTMVDTPMTQQPAFLEYLNSMKGKSYASFEEADKDMSRGRAMGIAFIQAEDVSRMVYWLAASEEARLITGAALPLDAGSLL